MVYFLFLFGHQPDLVINKTNELKGQLVSLHKKKSRRVDYVTHLPEALLTPVYLTKGGFGTRKSSGIL